MHKLWLYTLWLYTSLEVLDAGLDLNFFNVDKTEMFLELHGNSLVRLQCMEYVQQASTELIKWVVQSCCAQEAGNNTS